MGYNARNTKYPTTSRRCGREWEAQRDALATVRRFNATLSAKGYVSDELEAVAIESKRTIEIDQFVGRKEIEVLGRTGFKPR